MKFNHNKIEKKWQKRWEENKLYETNTNSTNEKFYVLDMFPYPSGSGLHVGHPKGYTATDIIARMKRMQGFNVLHTMGWDAFGLPAEQFAIDSNEHPKNITQKNINTFRRQIKELGFSYDWSREINTTDPNYYKWTQWIFIKMYEKGLAYMDEVPVNWCPALGTVLANEEVIDGKSERGGHPVIRKPMKQWMLKITAYADRLLKDLDDLDWSESLKNMQRNWIGRSEGTEITFKIDGHNETFSVFTTRPDTLFGASYMVLAPEHPLVDKISTPEQKELVQKYLNKVQKKSDLERSDLAKDKTGVFTGAYTINPVTKAKIPIWIADYVLMSYGDGAIMAVPAHDERDYAFAKKYDLPIIETVAGGDVPKEAYTGDGEHINSGFLNGLKTDEAISKMNEWLEENAIGRKKVTYRLRDWLFSRQRYWGEPIPIIHWEDGTVTTVPEEELPLELPYMTDIKPSGTGESPLANNTDWVQVVDPVTGKKGRRETNTMPQWAGSCWYFLRYIDPTNNDKLAEPSLLKKWLPVDLYIGGAEHAVLHLLYARFWHKFLYDIGVVPTNEPFQKLYNQGMILGEGNEKMSKSKGNVVNPDKIIASHGADTLRLYEMFMGPLDGSIAWSPDGIEGARRFLDRVWRLVISENGDVRKKIKEQTGTKDFEKLYHQTVEKVTEDFSNLRFNIGISTLMHFINEANKQDILPKEFIEGFVKLLSPIAPHITEELWEKLGHKNSIAFEPWPKFDKNLTKENEIEIIIQINGKAKARQNVERDISEDDMKKTALSDNRISSIISDSKILKIIIVKNKLINIVTD